MIWRHVDPRTLGSHDEDTSPDREARKKPIAVLAGTAPQFFDGGTRVGGHGTRFAEVRVMAKPTRNSTANVPRTHSDQPHADRTAPKGQQGASERPDEEIEATQDDDDFEDADEVDEDDEDAEDEDEAQERH